MTERTTQELIEGIKEASRELGISENTIHLISAADRLSALEEENKLLKTSESFIEYSETIKAQEQQIKELNSSRKEWRHLAVNLQNELTATKVTLAAVEELIEYINSSSSLSYAKVKVKQALTLIAKQKEAE